MEIDWEKVSAALDERGSAVIERLCHGRAARGTLSAARGHREPLERGDGHQGAFP